MIMTIKQARKDGKFPVTLTYEGERNMFGGNYPSRYLNKLMTLEQVEGHIAKAREDDVIANHTGLLLGKRQ